MKKNKFKEFTNKKGFMVAIYSCAAIVIAMTGIIASNKETNNDGNEPQTNQVQVEQANQSNVKSYHENQITGNGALTKNEKNLTLKEEKSTEKATEKKTLKSEKQETTEKTTEEQKSSSVEYTFFDDSKEMCWPLSGKIVMDYSMETAIYDKTLDQYRTNDTVCISGNVGDDVLASADGVIKEVSNDKENLTSIVIEHGNGWLSTYSQLQNDTLVREGDVVHEGTVIGKISEPSYKCTLLGPHLEFKVMQNDKVTDPKLVLASEE